MLGNPLSTPTDDGPFTPVGRSASQRSIGDVSLASEESGLGGSSRLSFRLQPIRPLPGYESLLRNQIPMQMIRMTEVRAGGQECALPAAS